MTLFLIVLGIIFILVSIVTLADLWSGAKRKGEWLEQNEYNFAIIVLLLIIGIVIFLIAYKLFT